MFLLKSGFNCEKHLILNVILYCTSFVIITSWNNINCYTNILYEPILCKFTFLLNDSTTSLYTIMIIYLLTFKKINLKKKIFFFFFVILQNYKYQNGFDFFIFSKANNGSLINGVLLIHPVFLYISICIVIYLYTHKFDKNVPYFIKITKLKKYLIFCSFFSIYLGCYWAQQETNWGGWWNWDPVELIALFLTVLALVITHITSSSIFFF